MLSILAFLSLSAFAGTENNYTYQTQVIATQADCATVASQWGQDFSQATGAKVKSATCRSEQTLAADGKTYKVYNLGLSYSAPVAYNPYTVLVGKRDALAPVRLYQEGLYSTMDSCLADVENQKALYESETEVQAVTATCVSDIPYSTVTQYFVKIEGFQGNKYGITQPKKNLYTFAPYAFEEISETRQQRAVEFLISFGATVVKEGTGIFVYYRAGGPAPINAEDVVHARTAAECEAQIPVAEEIFAKAGSKSMIVWCNENRLQGLHEGSYFLNQVLSTNSTQYGTFEQCVADKEFVLSDVRNREAIGAVCAPGMYDSSTYTMTLYRKSW